MKTLFASTTIVLALATGCASTPRAPEARIYDGPKMGAAVAYGCAGVAIESLRAGVLGVPVGATVLGVCMPIALGVAVLPLAAAAIHEAVPVRGYAGGADSGNFTYPDGSPALREGAYINGGRDSTASTFTTGYHQCFSRRCY